MAATLIKINAQRLSPDDRAVSLLNLALAYSEQGKYTDSERFFKRALALKEKQMGITNPALIPYIQQYAEMLRNAKRIDDAESLQKRIESLKRTDKKLYPSQKLETPDGLDA